MRLLVLRKQEAIYTKDSVRCDILFPLIEAWIDATPIEEIPIYCSDARRNSFIVKRDEELVDSNSPPL